ncbi:hypothetical protein AY601_4088 [Pedobacter cryoconitis]|uniref:Uncharacterized protein n=1 Tax=Pedobacter cryoconitis TaxID=188932 RepID=A0A127VJ54_9SPHI|nr:hypothetical protein [Pedobacter cryoconitis]AMQ00939.1 hypothetical protein AY601_4088 [Pedobacter cryoconitis]
MLFQVFPYPPVIKSMTATDSLKRTINLMHLKLDSLEKVVLKTEIGSGFFSDVISTNLYMFATIIGLAALISWGFISVILIAHKKKINKSMIASLALQDEKLSRENKELKEELTLTAFDVNRAMFNIVSSKNDHVNAFDWGMSTCISLILVEDFEPNFLEIWLKMAQEHLDKIELGSPALKDTLSKNASRLDNLLDVSSEVAQKTIEEIRSKMYLTAYTPQQPPEDIMKDIPPLPEII